MEPTFQFDCVLCKKQETARKQSWLYQLQVCDVCLDTPEAAEYVTSKMSMKQVDNTHFGEQYDMECDVCKEWKHGGIWYWLDNGFRPAVRGRRTVICDGCTHAKTVLGWLKLKPEAPYFTVDFSGS